MNNTLQNAKEHEQLKASVNAIQIQIGANVDIQNLMLMGIEKDVKSTLEQTILTNGRVTILEQDMSIIRLLKRNKWLSVVILFGSVKIFEVVDVSYLWVKLLSFL